MLYYGSSTVSLGGTGDCLTVLARVNTDYPACSYRAPRCLPCPDPYPGLPALHATYGTVGCTARAAHRRTAFSHWFGYRLPTLRQPRQLRSCSSQLQFHTYNLIAHRYTFAHTWLYLCHSALYHWP